MCKLIVAGLALTGMLAAPAAQAVFADSQKVLSAFTEQGAKAETTGFAIGLRTADRTHVYFQTGVSYQRITLKQQPAGYDEGRIRPLFLYGRLGMDWWLSPYFQAGIDLNGSLMQWLDTNNDSCCHAMARTGLELKLHDTIRFELYGNWYNLRYQSLNMLGRPGSTEYYADNQRFSRTTVGAQLSLVF
ncbi:hypothetical protein WG68_17315 [Arsukibacterium ikkense]|uniref:Outer membrane protein beta-barrel domain-containing protein n=1 Tax=Arsukibacterium ikkense TaxID=336831 RepID=A0A0M2V4I7_9GAMM|nr:hypothetical protein [Arsukibacterium ikkense]KKO44078.1 hypothetical protein WG68_17315 [Arsukibacterium ikkense]